MADYFETELVAIRPYRHGAWCVLARDLGKSDDDPFTIAQIVKKGGEQSARAWACWWDTMITAHGLEAATAALDEELARVEAFVDRWGVDTGPSTRPDLEHNPDTCACNDDGHGNGPCADCRALFAARRSMLATAHRLADLTLSEAADA